MAGSQTEMKLRTMRSSVTRGVFIAAWIPAAWLVFLWTHEAGHVVAAVLSGGDVQRVVLSPLAFSRTDVNPNPSPLVVAWGGAVVGPVVAGVVLLLLTRLPKHGVMLFQSLLGFVLIANGSYIGLGIIQPVGDALELLHHGADRWMLGGYGLVACGVGIGLWGGVRPFRSFSLNGKRSDWHAIGLLLGITMTLAVTGHLCCPA